MKDFLVSFIITFTVTFAVLTVVRTKDRKKAQKQMGDYQLYLHFDTVWVYDKGRLVKQYITRWDSQLDTIIMNDNQ